MLFTLISRLLPVICAALARLTVPPPVSVTSPTVKISRVVFPIELSEMLPELVIVPLRLVSVLLSPMKTPEFVSP